LALPIAKKLNRRLLTQSEVVLVLMAQEMRFMVQTLKAHISVRVSTGSAAIIHKPGLC